MTLPRVIPCLLLRRNGLIKTSRFQDPKYVGDPINALHIFNQKEVDEIIVLDVEASASNQPPNYDLIETFASECFMPLCYGGGVTSAAQARRLVQLGVEKICLNTPVLDTPDLVGQIAAEIGSCSTVICVDIKRDLWGRLKVYDHRQRRCTRLDPQAWIEQLIALGAGEIVFQSVDCDGLQQGYDLQMLQQLCPPLTIPSIALGGAGALSHFTDAWRAGASAVAAGSFFVFQGRHRAVLITYPDYPEIQRCYKEAQL